MKKKKRNAREKEKTYEIYKNAGHRNDYVYVNCLQETIENPSELDKEDQ